MRVASNRMHEQWCTSWAENLCGSKCQLLMCTISSALRASLKEEERLRQAAVSSQQGSGDSVRAKRWALTLGWLPTDSRRRISSGSASRTGPRQTGCPSHPPRLPRPHRPIRSAQPRRPAPMPGQARPCPHSPVEDRKGPWSDETKSRTWSSVSAPQHGGTGQISPHALIGTKIQPSQTGTRSRCTPMRTANPSLVARGACRVVSSGERADEEGKRVCAEEDARTTGSQS